MNVPGLSALIYDVVQCFISISVGWTIAVLDVEYVNQHVVTVAKFGRICTLLLSQYTDFSTCLYRLNNTNINTF